MQSRVNVMVSDTGNIKDIVPSTSKDEKDFFTVIDIYGNFVTVQASVAIWGLEALSKSKNKTLAEYINEVNVDPDGNEQEAKEENASNTEQPSSDATNQ